jgi:acyl carrier protein
MLDDIQNFIKSRLNIECSQEQLQDLSLLDSGYVDSFGLLELIGAIEERFSIRLDLAEVDPHVLTTFTGLCEVVHERVKKDLGE